MKGDLLGFVIVAIIILAAFAIFFLTIQLETMDSLFDRMSEEGEARQPLHTPEEKGEDDRQTLQEVIGLRKEEARKILEASGWEVSVGEWVTRPRWHGRVCFTCRTGENSIRLIIGAEEVYPPAP